MSAAKKLWKVDLQIVCDDEEMAIEAATEEEAIQIATRKIENCTYELRLDVLHATAKEIPYERPAGTDRWAAVAEELRFADDRHRYVADDGCWWWTNGHAALRCDGEPPTGAKNVGKKLADVIGDHRRRVVTWKDPENDKRLAKESAQVCVADKYARLVECGYPDAEWHAGNGITTDPYLVPMLAYSGGELVAVVMGMRV